jgi:hypothetical protein
MQWARIGAISLLSTLFAMGCRTVQPLAPADFSAPGWTIRQGQAVWKTQESDLAGELILAIHSDGSSALQFIKTPLPLVSAQTKGDRWTIRFFAENRTLSGRGTPPAQLLWLRVAPTLRAKIETGGDWEVRNAHSDQSISGFLNP